MNKYDEINIQFDPKYKLERKANERRAVELMSLYAVLDIQNNRYEEVK